MLFSHSLVSLCVPMDCSTPGFLVLHCLPEFAQTHVRWVSDVIHPFCHLLPPSLPLNLSQHQGLFQWVSSVGWPKSWSFSISPSNEYSRLISFRIDWFDLLAVCGTLKSLLQHYSSKALVLQCSAGHMTSGKTIALTIWTFVSKVVSLLFNMLSNFVMAFLPRSKHLLIAWLQWFWSPQNSIVSPSVCHEVMGPDAVILVFWMLSFKPIFHSPLPFHQQIL